MDHEATERSGIEAIEAVRMSPIGMPTSGGFRLGVDIGGTFTDATLIDEVTGEWQIAKIPSTPEPPSAS